MFTTGSPKLKAKHCRFDIRSKLPDFAQRLADIAQKSCFMQLISLGQTFKV